MTSLPAGVSQEISGFILLLLAMVWYLLFNVVTAARALPTELIEVSAIFGVKGWKRVTDIILPAVLPAFITGSLLAWGGGWNVVIYSEYVQLSGTVRAIRSSLAWGTFSTTQPMSSATSLW